MSAAVLVFALPGNDRLAHSLRAGLSAAAGSLLVRQFPDGETYVRCETDCDGCVAVLAANLYQPDPQLLPLVYATAAIREAGATRVLLVSPYLPYMRQDKRFKPGEVVTSQIFAELLSAQVDGLVTVDPHLHRYTSLDQIYQIPTRVAHAAASIAQWIRAQVPQPLIVGPDSESEQWVSEVAGLTGAPFIVLEKTRLGDREVKITVPPLAQWRDYTPVLVDDIVSTGRTMMATIEQLSQAGYRAPVCIAVHAIFAPMAEEGLKRAGAAELVTCDSIAHPTNQIELAGPLAQCVNELLR